MIDVQVRIHDKYSVEFKFRFELKQTPEVNDFVVNTWFFVPNGLDINALTYSKGQFYRDVKSSIRLITPIFLLREIAGGSAVPLRNLERSFNALAVDPSRSNIADYEYQIKMFAAIFKSALRDEVRRLNETHNDHDLEYQYRSYVANVEQITTQYRELKRIINVPTVDMDVRSYYAFGDEFISNLVEQQSFRLIAGLESKDKTLIEPLKSLIGNEISYKRRVGYLTVDKDSPNNNRDLIFRHSILKKYVESDLFLRARRKRDAVWVEQVYFSLAAGFSMIFATAIAFSFQQKYGNYTMPLFVALVVSYMLKDRIKDLMRYYFAHRLGTKYFDNKTTISMKDEPIGWSKEGVDFITDSKAPKTVMDIRSRSQLLKAENRINVEKIILYRKLVRLNSSQVESDSQYPVAGINDITRFNIISFIQKMDNSKAPLYTLDDRGQPLVIDGLKVYYLNFVMQFVHESQLEYRRFRVVFNREGIIEVEEM